MKKYQITASCDPYNARRHFNEYNNIPLKYDGTTCVKWVENNAYGEGLTLDEAYDILDIYANQLNDNTSYYDDELVKQMAKELLEYEGEEMDRSWYEGAGWYEDNSLIYRHGDMYLRDDVLLYTIEEMD